MATFRFSPFKVAYRMHHLQPWCSLRCLTTLRWTAVQLHCSTSHAFHHKSACSFASLAKCSVNLLHGSSSTGPTSDQILRKRRSTSSFTFSQQSCLHSLGRLEPGAIVAVNDAKSMTTEGLFSEIEPLAEQIAHNGTLHIVILVSSSLLSLVQTNLPQLVEKIVGTRSGVDSPVVQVLLAAVDRIPVPDVGSFQISDHKHPSERQLASDGIAYAFVPQIVLDPSQAGEESISRTNAVLGTPSTLAFKGLDRSGSINVGFQGSSTVNFDIKLALANTIFQNGWKSTLEMSRFDLDDSGEWRQAAPIHIQEAQVFLALNKEEPNRSNSTIHLSATVPLTILTVPRKVRAAAGNILKQLDGGDGSALPASTELETAVAQHFVATRTTPHQIDIWALIQREESRELTRYKNEGPSEELTAARGGTGSEIPLENLDQGIVWNEITRGSKLVKVLSGGGGWGQNAGLLSLDPDRLPASLISHSDVPACETEIDAAFSELPPFLNNSGVVSPGDTISFWTSDQAVVSSKLNQPAPEHIHSLESRSRLIFGSSNDAYTTKINSTEGPSYPSPNVKGNVKVFKKLFGALSGNGLGLALYGEDYTHSSKLDVPGSRLSIEFRES